MDLKLTLSPELTMCKACWILLIASGYGDVVGDFFHARIILSYNPPGKGTPDTKGDQDNGALPAAGRKMPSRALLATSIVRTCKGISGLNLPPPLKKKTQMT